MKIKIEDTAVAEVIGAIILLAIAISVFSIIYMNVLSDEGPKPDTHVMLIGKMDGGNAVFEHEHGEGIDTNSNVFMQIGGLYGEVDITTVYNLLDPNWRLDGIWNIGEKLIYHPNQNLSDVKIDATIRDKKNNDIVFEGNLQDGYTVPPFGRGGLWHFNESCWHNGIFGEVEDSSGNENHGTAYNGANTTSDVVSSLANRSGIFNAVDYNDYVEVLDAYSLDITEHITMEAWIKPFFDYHGSTELMDQFGYTPYIVGISDNKYLCAIVSEDQNQKGIIQTVNITPRRPLSYESLIDIDYDFGQGHTPKDLRPIIYHVSDTIYVVAYNNNRDGNNLSIYLKTYNINSNGSIKYTGYEVFDDNDSDIREPNRPSIVKVSDFKSYSILAIAYGINVDENHTSMGIIKTVNISNDGKINFTGETAIFDNVEGYRPEIIHVADDIFAIAYRNTSNLGVVKTFNISSDGSIKYTGEKFIFDNKINNKYINPPSIVKVSNSETYSIFAVAYGAYTDHSIPASGMIKTLKIYYSNGTIIGTGFYNKYETSSCYNPYIIHHTENYYIVAYDTEPFGNSKGNYTAIQIDDNGNIISFGPIETFNQNRSSNPIVIKFSERTFTIVYESIAGGSGHPGYLQTIQIEYPSDFYSIGIHKTGSYGIYANPTKAYVNINTKKINASILPNSWNFIVLTYDRNLMKLYVNGILQTSKSMIESINITDSNLIIGNLFYGLIDEVAIYDKTISYKEVQDHFKKFAPIITYNINTLNITYSSTNITWDTNIPGNSIVRYGITTPPINIESDVSMLTHHSISLTSLISNTLYYYEIQSTDQYGNTIIDNNGGRYYTFITQNRQPYIPKFPNPNDGKKNIKPTVILSWTGGDPDEDDVTYDVYLDINNPPLAKVSANQTFELYNPDPDLILPTTYYWQIIAWDSKDVSTAGPIWSFITRED